jgi:hypothetical protein
MVLSEGPFCTSVSVLSWLHQFSINTSKEEKHLTALSGVFSPGWKNKKCTIFMMLIK